MAYMNQERKKAIHERLKGVIPKTWKWSLRTDRHSITLTIRKADVDLIQELYDINKRYHDGWANNTAKPTSHQLNCYHLNIHFDRSLELMTRINDAMNVGNHDNSDIMTDYFDVGWYAYIHLGEWNKPFVYTG